MATIQAHIARAREAGMRISLGEAIAVLAAILSLLTLTVLVPGGLHLP